MSQLKPSEIFSIFMTVSRALLLWILLLLKGVALGLLIVFGPIHLAPDEAQYWTWSQALDWGYFSKPPAVAWQIASTTFFLGNTELGVRFGALLIGLAIPLVCYYLAPLNRQVAFWGALALAFSPLGFFLSFAATTDGGTVLFFLLAILILARGIEHPEGPNYYLVGLCVFFGALFKWTAFFLWPVAFAFLPLCPLMRKKSIIWGILISLLALLPSLYWNWTHDFSTFRHVFATLYRTSDRASSVGNFFDFLAAQMGLMSPIFFVAFLFGIWVLCWRTEKASAPLLMLATFPLVLELYLFLAFFKKIQGNWAVYFLPPAFLIAAWFLITKKARLWLHIGLYLSIALIAFGVSIPYLQENNLIPLSYKANPFRQNMGWNKLTTVLVEAGYNPSEDFLFGGQVSGGEPS